MYRLSQMSLASTDREFSFGLWHSLSHMPELFKHYFKIILVEDIQLCLKHNFFSLSSTISNQSTWVLYELMCWLSLVVRSPPTRRSLCRGFNQLLIDVWLLVSEVSTLSLIMLTTQTMVTTGILPPQGKSPC